MLNTKIATTGFVTPAKRRDHVAFYSFYVHAPRLLSLTPLADQQLGVVILEAFMGLGFVVAFVASYSRYDDSHWYD